MKQYMEKRKGRADVYLDYDDILILAILSTNDQYVQDLIKQTNMSFNAVKTHYQRMANQGFVDMLTPVDEKLRFQGKPIRVIRIIGRGRLILKNILSHENFDEKFYKKFPHDKTLLTKSRKALRK